MTSLITLPIRLSLELSVRAAKLGIDVLRAVGGLLESDGAEDPGGQWVAEQDNGSAPSAAPVPPPAPDVVVAATPAPPGPRHVDSEPELAYEAGPADDPGASIHVDAPWEDYDRLRAADIVARLRSADDATRAVVRLYEQQGKARSSVLAATG
jgi:hypothetical protein